MLSITQFQKASKTRKGKDRMSQGQLRTGLREVTVRRDTARSIMRTRRDNLCDLRGNIKKEDTDCMDTLKRTAKKSPWGA